MPAPESTSQITGGFNFDNTYTTLPPVFFAPAQPAAVNPRLVIFNRELAQNLGIHLEDQGEDKLAQIFSGQDMPEGAASIAQAYAGHQFGHFAVLGDGRALLMGEHVTPDGRRVDLQFKGSGPTSFSRRGDGKAALGPMLREYIISEALHALGLPTTRSLAVVSTGEPVYREDVLPGAILTRVAASHIRVGTFEFAAAYASESGDAKALRALADYTIQRHYGEVFGKENRYVAFFEAVADRQAKLIAGWQLIGFIHGVMNTDNMAISGESIDFGPCAFMDAFNPATVFSSIDQQGRYAYGNQPRIGSWNLARLAETLLTLFAEDEQAAIELGKHALAKYNERFNHYWLAGMRAKVGLGTDENDADFITSLLSVMHQHGADYTNTFRALSQPVLPQDPLFQSAEFKAWETQWQLRLAKQNISRADSLRDMQAINPAVIPRNHKVEEALASATGTGDLDPLHKLLAAVRDPYTETPANAEYRQPAPTNTVPYRTFCGT